MARYTYVISDIHGQMDALMKILDKIQFTEHDELYILGDVIDRGSQSLECIQWIMEQDNVLTLLGNHELIFYDNCIHNAPALYHTLEEVRRKLDKEQQQKIITWIENMPECKLITVNGQKFFLNHTQIPSEQYFQKDLTDRFFPDYSIYKDYHHLTVKNFICIHGHIPTMQMRIWHGQSKNNKIWTNPSKTILDIDCGSGYPKEGGCLGCLRLNDMQEFYVEL